jgi:hypothetical protein
LDRASGIAAPAVTNDPRPRANISVEPKSGLDPLIQNLPVIGRFRAPCEEGHHMANPIRKPRTRAHFASQIAAEWPVEAPVLDGADAYLTGFLRAILKAQDSATRDLAVANFRGELRTRRLNVADIAIIVRPLVN